MPLPLSLCASARDSQRAAAQIASLDAGGVPGGGVNSAGLPRSSDIAINSRMELKPAWPSVASLQDGRNRVAQFAPHAGCPKMALLGGTGAWQARVINESEKAGRTEYFRTLGNVATFFARQAHAKELAAKCIDGTYAGTPFDAYVCALVGDAPEGVDAETHLKRCYSRVKSQDAFNKFVIESKLAGPKLKRRKGWSLRTRQTQIKQFKEHIKERFHLEHPQHFTGTCPFQIKCIQSGDQAEIENFCDKFVLCMVRLHGHECENKATEIINEKIKKRREKLAIRERRLVMLWWRRRLYPWTYAPMPPPPLSDEKEARNKVGAAMAARTCGAAVDAAAAACRADAVRAAPATPTQEAARAARAAPATPTQEAAPDAAPDQQPPAAARAVAGPAQNEVVAQIFDQPPDAPQSPPPPKKLGPDVTQLSPRQAPTGTTESPLQDVSSPPAARVKRRDRKARHVRVGPNSPVRRQGRREPRGQGAATRRGHFDLPPPPANTFPEPAPEAPNGGAPLGANTELGDALNRVDCAERRAADAKARVNGLIAQLAEVVGLRDAADERAAMAKEDCDLSKTRAEALAADIAAAEARAAAAEKPTTVSSDERIRAVEDRLAKQASRHEREMELLHVACDAAEARARKLEEQLKNRADRALGDDTE